jgi:hypothetical protein
MSLMSPRANITFVEKQWDGSTILVDEALLNLAKQLFGVYGITGPVSPMAAALECEFVYPPCSDDVSRAMVIASRELGEERRLTDGEISAQAAVEGVNRSVSNRWCNHRCQSGKHCGGCGCPGCGYTA